MERLKRTMCISNLNLAFAKGLYAEGYTIMYVTQGGLAIAQPFILNVCTPLVVEWLPVNEHATATGIGTLGQYAAEKSYPALESMSQGLILMTGQLYGILFIIGMDTFRTGITRSMAPSMIVFVLPSPAATGMCIKLKESEFIKKFYKLLQLKKGVIF